MLSGLQVPEEGAPQGAGHIPPGTHLVDVCAVWSHPDAGQEDVWPLVATPNQDCAALIHSTHGQCVTCAVCELGPRHAVAGQLLAAEARATWLLGDTALPLQEDKRLRVAHLHAEDSERESFSLLSAAVRESHEKERARAERTKNWSLVGSVLGALIGVAGSTYVNRVRLQELKAVLLEAQKGPASLQQALRDQASSYSLQQKDLHDLMVDLRGLVQAGSEQSSGTRAGTPATRDQDVLSAALKEQLSHSRQVHSSLEGLREQLHGLEKNFSQTARTIQLAEASARPGLGQPADSALPGPLLESGSLTLALSDMEQRLEAQVHRSALCSTLVTGVAFVATLPVLYLLFRTS